MVQAETTDRIVAKALGGDPDAVAALWRQHRRWVAAVLIAHKPAEADVDDLLQEVAMTMVAKIHTVRDGTNVRAWLRTVAVNSARAMARRARSRPRLTSAEDVTNLPSQGLESGPGMVAESEGMDRVLGHVTELPEVYREPLLLRALQGMSSREISEILEIPPATVDTRVARARRMLREQLEGDPSWMGRVPGGADQRQARVSR